MISISHAPNTDTAQQKLAFRSLLPWRWRSWKNGADVPALETEMRAMHGAQGAFAFSTGREALQAVLQACGLKPGDEVIIQAYTCIVVPNAVVWAGATPVYVDVDHTLNIDPALIEAKITPKTRAIIAQHTFGIPADMARIKTLCKKHNLKLIEDCAHALGASYAGKAVGTLGDAAIFSFGRDKVISSVSGGVAIAMSTDISRALQAIHESAGQRPILWIKQNLLHPLIVPACARLMGKLKIGEILLTLAQTLRLLNRVYTVNEKSSKAPAVTYHKMPNVLAKLARQQLQDCLQIFNGHRFQIARTYKQFCEQNKIEYQQSYADTNPVYLRFACFTVDTSKLMAAAKKSGYLLGDWYSSVIVPAPRDAARLGYRPGSCPKAESFAQRSLNLPTHHKMASKHQQILLNALRNTL